MQKEFKSISVLIVNYNSGSYAVECIRSLLSQQSLKIEVIVVDNASQDGSLKLLYSAYANAIKLIESKENLGFGRANNLAAMQAEGDYLLLLNPDTVIPDSDALVRLIAFLDNNPQMGMIGPAIDEPRRNKRVLPKLSYPSVKKLKYTEKFQALPGSIAWILGACLLIKRTTYQQLGGFDPDYFLYGEDVDLCLRLRLAGYQIGYTETVRIIHVAGASEIGAEPLQKWLRKKRGLFLFLKKHLDKRDMLKLANSAIKASSNRLWLMKIGDFIYSKKKQARINKKCQLEATKLAASEVIADLTGVCSEP